MKIIKKQFDWVRPLTPLNLSKVTAIGLHHMEHMTAGMDEIHRWHVADGMKGFAYNWWVDFEGNAYECRGFNAGGALYDPLNACVISIGFQGNYDISENMPKAQFKTGYELIRYLRTKIPTIELISGHSHWQDKSCPGKYFPLGHMISMAETAWMIKDYDNIADWAKESVLTATRSGIMHGYNEGCFYPESPITRQEVAVVVDRLLKKIT